METKLKPEKKEFVTKITGAGSVTVSKVLTYKLMSYKLIKKQDDIEQLKNYLNVENKQVNRDC